MKFTSAIFSACFISIILLINCKKEKVGNYPPPQSPIFAKVKIVEYGSEVPIGNVTLTLNECTSGGKMGCTKYKEIRSWTSTSDGTVTVLRNQISSTNAGVLMAKEQYHWTTNDLNRTTDTVFLLTAYDSIIMRMYPHAWIKFHFKSTNNYSAKERLRVYMQASPDNKYDFEIESPFIVDPLANNLDIRLTHKTYGNVKNRLVCELLDSNFNLIKNITDQTRFFAKADTLSWDITY